MLKVSDTPNKDGLWSVHDEADQCVALVYDYGLAREMVEILNDAQQSERCSCIPCKECNGSGRVWLDFDGTYLGRRRCDDMDEMETCKECRGSGMSKICDECLFEDAG